MPLPLKQLTALFKSLSDGGRLRLVNLLNMQSLCVGEMQEVLRLSQPYVSRHLAILRAASLVRTKRHGSKVRYSLARAPFLNYPLGRFLNEVAPFFSVLQADAERLVELKGGRAKNRRAQRERAPKRGANFPARGVESREPFGDMP